MEVREVLEGMLDVLHKKEWIQGHLYKVNGRLYDVAPYWLPDVQGVCLEGACNQALRNRIPVDEWSQMKVRVNDAIMAAVAESGKYQDWMSSMFEFNDFVGTTREDVILAVKTALEGS